MAASHESSGGMFERFIHSEVSGSVVLMLCAITALVLANSDLSELYFDIAHTYVGVSWGEHSFKLSVEHWIADGLMGIFFFVVGLEIKREIVVGELSSARNAILPVGAAIGGMLVPAAFYLAFNLGGETSRGWGVPMATDIAFALGLLALFGKRAPTGLKVFLAALAIADDLGAVLVIAFFYTEQIVVAGLLGAGGCLFFIYAASRANVRRLEVYLLLGAGVWVGVLVSGVHATIAGVLVAFLVPVKSAIAPEEFIQKARGLIDKLESSGVTKESLVLDAKQNKAAGELYLAADDLRPPGLSLEHHLHPLQAFLILPLFALFKAGVEVNAESLGRLTEPVGLGIIAGLVIGKPIGVALFSWLAVKSGRAALPEGVTWPQIVGVGFLAGVGFTMSIFIGELAFLSPETVAEAKVATMIASLTAGICGFAVLRSALPRL